MATSNPKFLAVVQSRLTTADFLVDRFSTKLDNYLSLVRQKVAISSGNENSDVIVLFPELIGSWLVVNANPKLIESPTLTSAMTSLIIRSPFKFLYYFMRSMAHSGVRAFSLMQHAQRAAYWLVAPKSLQLYFDIFSSAARKYNCWIAAGSSFIPEVEDISDIEDKVATCPKITNAWTLFNTSFLFNNLGRVVGKFKKCFTIEDEKFLDRSNTEEWKSAPTPFGNIMVLICADSWYPESYQAAKRCGSNLVLVPSFSSPGPDWTKPWSGYNGFAAPSDVDVSDIGKISLSEAWIKYSLAGRLKSAGANFGAMCYEVGSVWDMTANGQSYVCAPSQFLQQLEGSSEGILIHRVQ